MKAIVFENIRKAAIRDVTVLEIGPYDVLIRVKAAGFCKTDVDIYEGEYFAEFPLIPGYEFSGVVEDIGEYVTTFAAGDRVTADPDISCGRCYFCKLNQQNQCEHLEEIGVTRDGAFAEYVVVPEGNVFHIGELSFQDAAMIEPVSCVVYGLQQIPVQLGAEVLIFGAGPIGLILMQLIKHNGASRVVMVEKRSNRIQLARILGSDEVVTADGREAETIKDLSPSGFDVVVDATGNPKVIEHMIDYVRTSGILFYFGVCPKDATIQIKPYEIFRRDLTIYGSFALRNAFAPAIRLLQNRVVHVASLVSHTLPLEQFDEALKTVRSRDAMKVQLHP